MIKKLLLLAVAAMVFPALGSAEIPPIIYANWDHLGKDYPTWVEAEAAIAPSGADFNDDLFYPQNSRNLRSNLATLEIDSERGCRLFEEYYVSMVNPPFRGTLKDAIDNSSLVAFSRVVGQAYGFDRGTPGQLLEVAIDRSFKSAPFLESYFIFIPIGVFQSGPFRICKSDGRYATPPAIGERVLLMIPPYSPLDEPFLDLVWETSLITFSQDGAARLPDEFRLPKSDDVPFKSMSDYVKIEHMIESITAKKAEQ